MQTLLNLVEAQARQRPGAAAILDVRGEALSYVGLAVQLRKTAHCLARLGLKRNERVAIVLPNGPEMAVSFLAVSGVATSAPLNPGYSMAEFEFYLRDLKAKALITGRGLGPGATQAAEALAIPVVTLTPTPEAQAGTFELALTPAPSPSKTKVEFAQPDDVALVLHTSGTTSKPKIVPLTHRNLVCSAHSIARSLDLTPNERCLNIMPLFHVHGLLGALCSSLSAGGSVVCSPGFYAAELFHWMEEFKPTWFTAVPTMHQAILARAATTGGVPRQHRLRFIRSCSSALSPRLMGELQAAFRVPVIEAYGMTEAAHQMASNPLPPGKRKPGSVGIATGPEVAIIDEANRLTPAGVTGEIVIRGESVTVGYEGNSEANQQAFINSWFRTGDQGHLDAEGYLFLTGRIKEIINRGGEKISPREIDEALLDHPAVAQAVAFAIPDSKLGEEVGAAIVLRERVAATETDIRNFAAGRLAHFKVPSRVVFLAEIPKGPTGKLQRIDLARILKLTGGKAAASPRAPFIAPGSALETTLAGIWEDVLGVGRIGLNDSFQDLGGDSLGCTRVVSRIRQAFEVEVPLAEILMASTLTDQAAIVKKALNGQTPRPADLERLLNEVESLSIEQAREMLKGTEGNEKKWIS